MKRHRSITTTHLQALATIKNLALEIEARIDRLLESETDSLTKNVINV